MYLLEGIKPLTDAFETGMDVEKFFVREGSGVGMTGFPEDKITALAPELFRTLTDTETSQGVVAVVGKPCISAESFADMTGQKNILIMDRLQDPGNAGTIIRTAEAAGFAGVIAMKATTDIYAPKVVRAASGSLFRMPVLTDMDEGKIVDFLREKGWKIAISTVDGGEDCFAKATEGPVALVIGNEGAGVSEMFKQEADIRLMIPMDGEIESLNAAVASGILMYQIRQKIR